MVQAAGAARREARVGAAGRPRIQVATRPRSRVAAAATGCGRVLASPRRRPAQAKGATRLRERRLHRQAQRRRPASVRRLPALFRTRRPGASGRDLQAGRFSALRRTFAWRPRAAFSNAPRRALFSPGTGPDALPRPPRGRRPGHPVCAVASSRPCGPARAIPCRRAARTRWFAPAWPAPAGCALSRTPGGVASAWAMPARPVRVARGREAIGLAAPATSPLLRRRGGGRGRRAGLGARARRGRAAGLRCRCEPLRPARPAPPAAPGDQRAHAVLAALP